MNGRIQARAAASLLGVTARTVQNLANRGELPGAAKIGKVWTFDPAKLAKFIRAKESECPKTTFISAAQSGGYARPSTESNVEKAYEQTMLRLRGGSVTRG
jgi:phage terminase Nu1 subunit (DNA packaging protein)